MAERVNYSRGATFAGAEQVFAARHGMCAPLPVSLGGTLSDPNFPNAQTTRTAREETAKTFRVGESFSWSMPFETLHDDFRSVRNDVLEFGREVILDLQESLDNPNIGFQCTNLACATESGIAAVKA